MNLSSYFQHAIFTAMNASLKHIRSLRYGTGNCALIPKVKMGGINANNFKKTQNYKSLFSFACYLISFKDNIKVNFNIASSYSQPHSLWTPFWCSFFLPSNWNQVRCGDPMRAALPLVGGREYLPYLPLFRLLPTHECTWCSLAPGPHPGSSGQLHPAAHCYFQSCWGSRTAHSWVCFTIHTFLC